MRFAEKNWALIRHAGSAPEASIGSKPLGSELAWIRAILAPKCQGFVDVWLGSPRYEGAVIANIETIQELDSKEKFAAFRVHLASLSPTGARR